MQSYLHICTCIYKKYVTTRPLYVMCTFISTQVEWGGQETVHPNVIVGRRERLGDGRRYFLPYIL